MGAQRRRRALAPQQAGASLQRRRARRRRRLVHRALGRRGRHTDSGDFMELMLERIEQRAGAQSLLYPLALVLVPNAITVLLGATQAGKTTLMRVMAGLDKPHGGRVLVDGADVTGRAVRGRNVAMVYQQFINYTSMTVADNIASPLKLRKEANVDARVLQIAKKLRIE